MSGSDRRYQGGETQLVIAQVIEVVVHAARFLTGQAADATVDGLAFEAGAGRLDLRDDIAARELGGADALVQSFDGVENGGSTAWAAIGDLGLHGRDTDGRPVDGVVAVRIV